MTTFRENGRTFLRSWSIGCKNLEGRLQFCTIWGTGKELERIAIQFWIRGKERNAFQFFAWRIGKDRIPDKMDRLTCKRFQTSKSIKRRTAKLFQGVVQPYVRTYISHVLP